MSDVEKFAIGIGLTLVGLVLLFIWLSVIPSGHSQTSVEIQGLTAHELRMAVMRCTPLSATFEQELACYQAVYGGRK